MVANWLYNGNFFYSVNVRQVSKGLSKDRDDCFSGKNAEPGQQLAQMQPVVVKLSDVNRSIVALTLRFM